ncbi:hypothetical protein CN952_21790 [Bacillus cereus]|uniref:hypothetical protein n=1 Tax=Bacillus cereus TaxID=1396 RepID=UPI000BFB4DA3|nr:hypothetical protein [Bacillus cereus]PGM69898.1 hypothetical protein CN952_21790 [Bacillus cereus]PGN13509.1 hypothetical protein CN954_10925 [Bacillus cereus]
MYYPHYNYNNPIYRQDSKPLYIKDELTQQLLMFQNDQWYQVLNPSTSLVAQDLSGCNCCVYRDPQNFNNNELTHSSGECPRKNTRGWPLERTFYNCSSWNC